MLEDITTKNPFAKGKTIVEYIRRNRKNQLHKVGVLVSFVDERDLLRIGYSLCNKRKDNFDRNVGKTIAVMRAMSEEAHNKKDQSKLAQDKVPPSVKDKYEKFMNRSLLYFMNPSPRRSFKEYSE